MTRGRSRLARGITKALVGVVIVLIALTPLWWMVNVVFADPGSSLALQPRLYPTSLAAGWNNIVTVWTDGTFANSILNSFLYTTLEVLGGLLVCTLAAFEFAHGKFRARKILYALALIGLMIPVAVTAVPAQRVVTTLGWLNQIPGIVLPGVATAFGLFLLTSYMSEVPTELIEAAEVDGLKRFSIYWRIALPLTRNGILSVGILLAIASWGNYLWPLIVAIDPSRYPVSVAVASYFSTRSHQTTGVILAAALLASIPLVLIYIVLQRFIVDSIARAGLRG